MQITSQPASYIVPRQGKKWQKIALGVGVFLFLFLGPLFLRPFFGSPQPTIDTVTPIEFEDDFLFDIEGSNFFPDSTVHASTGGTTVGLDTKFISPTKIRATLPRAYVPPGTSPNTIPVVVNNNNGSSSGTPPSSSGTDTTPPTISAVTVSPAITSATISWTTSESADSQVAYGLSSSYGLVTPLDTARTTAHQVTLSGLTANTVYYYRITSRDAASNSQLLQGTFKTNAQDGTPDTAAPVISDINVFDLTATLAKVVWITNENASGKVEFGVGNNVSSVALPSSSELLKFHSVALTNLSANTKYTYRVVSADANGRTSTSTPLREFTTLSSTTPPATDFKITGGPVVSSVTKNRATVQWFTSRPSTRTVDCGLTTAYEDCDEEPSIISLVTDPTVIFKNLKPNTEYHYRVVGVDAQGTQLSAEDRKDRTFRTLSDGSGGTAHHQITSGPEVASDNIGSRGFVISGTTEGSDDDGGVYPRWEAVVYEVPAQKSTTGTKKDAPTLSPQVATLSLHSATPDAELVLQWIGISKGPSSQPPSFTYELLASEEPITQENLANAKVITGRKVDIPAFEGADGLAIKQGLTPYTKYYFVVRAKDPAGKEVKGFSNALHMRMPWVEPEPANKSWRHEIRIGDFTKEAESPVGYPLLRAPWWALQHVYAQGTQGSGAARVLDAATTYCWIVKSIVQEGEFKGDTITVKDTNGKPNCVTTKAGASPKPKDPKEKDPEDPNKPQDPTDQGACPEGYEDTRKAGDAGALERGSGEAPLKPESSLRKLNKLFIPTVWAQASALESGKAVTRTTPGATSGTTASPSSRLTSPAIRSGVAPTASSGSASGGIPSYCKKIEEKPADKNGECPAGFKKGENGNCKKDGVAKYVGGGSVPTCVSGLTVPVGGEVRIWALPPALLSAVSSEISVSPAFGTVEQRGNEWYFKAAGEGGKFKFEAQGGDEEDDKLTKKECQTRIAALEKAIKAAAEEDKPTLQEQLDDLREQCKKISSVSLFTYAATQDADDAAGDAPTSVKVLFKTTMKGAGGDKGDGKSKDTGEKVQTFSCFVNIRVPDAACGFIPTVEHGKTSAPFEVSTKNKQDALVSVAPYGATLIEMKDGKEDRTPAGTMNPITAGTRSNRFTFTAVDADEDSKEHTLHKGLAYFNVEFGKDKDHVVYKKTIECPLAVKHGKKDKLVNECAPVTVAIDKTDGALQGLIDIDRTRWAEGLEFNIDSFELGDVPAALKNNIRIVNQTQGTNYYFIVDSSLDRSKEQTYKLPVKVVLKDTTDKTANEVTECKVTIPKWSIVVDQENTYWEAEGPTRSAQIAVAFTDASARIIKIQFSGVANLTGTELKEFTVGGFICQKLACSISFAHDGKNVNAGATFDWKKVMIEGEESTDLPDFKKAAFSIEVYSENDMRSIAIPYRFPSI